MKTEDLLECNQKSILVIEERSLKEIVVAAPHHAPLGTTELPCDAHLDADENVGFLALYIAKLLNCNSIIACNYFIDSNKLENSDYFQRIKSWHPKILIEIHGHGGKKAKYDIEISSGNINRNRFSTSMAEKLSTKVSNLIPLQKLMISGDFREIYFKAEKSKTITSDDWIAFHIELPKSLRSEKSLYLPFCEKLSEVIKEMLLDYDKEGKQS